MPTLTNRTYRTKKEKNGNKDLGYVKSKDWASFYNSHKWKTLRQWYMNEHPLCENCLKYSLSTEATDCHHIKPFRLGKSKDDKWDLFTDPNNLMALCQSCHQRIHNKINELHQVVTQVTPEKIEALEHD